MWPAVLCILKSGRTLKLHQLVCSWNGPSSCLYSLVPGTDTRKPRHPVSSNTALVLKRHQTNWGLLGYLRSWIWVLYQVYLMSVKVCHLVNLIRLSMFFFLTSPVWRVWIWKVGVVNVSVREVNRPMQQSFGRQEDHIELQCSFFHSLIIQTHNIYVVLFLGLTHSTTYKWTACGSFEFWVILCESYICFRISLPQHYVKRFNGIQNDSTNTRGHLRIFYSICCYWVLRI